MRPTNGWTVVSSDERDPQVSWGNQVNGVIGGSSVQARTIEGGVHITMDRGTSLPAPAQLPAPGLFADRQDELAALLRLSEPAAQSTDAESGRPTLVVITGPGGVGKTTLALHWLHKIKIGYEGQLFVDLRGFSAGDPLPPGEPLERFLRALGADIGTIPADIDEQAGLFRSMTAGRRLIIMLDNAVSAAQVRTLLPGAGPALVVVTTRRRLSGLLADGARFFDLEPFDVSGALELLGRLIGEERLRAEHDQAGSLVRLCGLLPLAVCASGAQLAARRRWTISRVVADLDDEARRLSTLYAAEGERSVQAVFNASYRALGPVHARAYRLLGTHPGGEFGLEAAAALLGGSLDRTAGLLDDLVDASLLAEGTTPEDPGAEGVGDRYRFHDLVRLHATGLAREHEPEEERRAALERLADWYLSAAVAADLLLMPGRWHLGGYYAAERRAEAAAAGGTLFGDRSSALDWLELERLNLVAVARQAHRSGLHALAWQICEAMWPLLLQRKHYRTWLEVHELGRDAAAACSDPRAKARMLEGLGLAHLNLQDFAAARDCYREALALERRVAHRLGEASALEGLGLAALADADPEQAIELFSEARDVHA